jgi:hypothetical protein
MTASSVFWVCGSARVLFAGDSGSRLTFLGKGPKLDLENGQRVRTTSSRARHLLSNLAGRVYIVI